jgi:hypothetical protein
MIRVFSSCAIALSLAGAASAQIWTCYGANAQHTGIYSGSVQALQQIKWQASLDDDRSYYGGVVFIHYASPMITVNNTVVHGYRHTTVVNNQNDYDNWSVIARSGATGNVIWQFDTDYSAALIWPNDWTTVFPMTLCTTGSKVAPVGLAAAAAGGSILIKPSVDGSKIGPSRYVFYTSLSDYTANAAKYAPIKINTPLTADKNGNIFFGYEVTASIPSTLASLGHGGIGKVNAVTGATSYISTTAMGIDSSIPRLAMNAAPAISADGTSLYVALVGDNCYLAKLNTSNLATTAHVVLTDPSIAGADASLIDESSGSPMVGPDGHVYMGVFGNQWRESHGWMLQFDGNLSQTDANGKQFPVGSFGWDDTAAVVPASCVPSYTGASTYLLLTKYNNYDDSGSDPGADGSNKVAIIDPSSNSITTDRQSGIPVMNEIITVLGPSLTNSDSQHPSARYEWCINSAAIDVNGKGAIINSEDGHVYRWNFVTNSITQAVDLQPATGEAYTCTCIGPDGQVYAINNSILFAVGSAPGGIHLALPPLH